MPVMFFFSYMRRAVLSCAVILAALLSVSAQAQSVGHSAPQSIGISLEDLSAQITKLDLRYAPTTMQSVFLAETALDEVQPLQKQLQSWFLVAERACYERFFVNACLDEAKLMRRKHNVILQRVSIEAKAFLRKDHIEHLDNELKLKNTQ
ncbi:hypothetical protein [Undibacterium sp. RuTC16W]|uniref:hypothetical protein n=1 Tax=Undibacterium sp. RuTC16W TaxID=3413048 RepID=UPI003BF2E3CA